MLTIHLADFWTRCATLLMVVAGILNGRNKQMILRSGRLQELDGLRGIAALGVLLYHYNYGYWLVVLGQADKDITYPGAHVFYYFHLGVEMFFIISGFVILLTIERTPNWLQFILNRAVRLMPAFYACTAITAGLILSANFNPVHVGTPDVLANLTMAPNLFHRVAVDPSSWSLLNEISFYALATIAFYAGGVRRYELICLAWLIPSVLEGLRLIPSYSRPYTLLNLQFAPLFTAGMMLYLIHARRANVLTLVTLGAAAAAEFVIEPLATAGAALAFGAVILAAAEGRLPFLAAPSLVFLGAISYPLYLVHQIVGYWVIHTLSNVGWSHLTGCAAALCVSVGLAMAVNRVVEKPIQAMDRRLRQRRKAALATG